MIKMGSNCVVENCYTCTRRDQFGGVGFCSAASAIADGGEKQVRISCLGVEIGRRLDFLCSVIELRLCNILVSIQGGESGTSAIQVHTDESTVFGCGERF